MPAENPNLHAETLAAQGMGRVAVPYRDIVPALYLSTTYERGADGSYPGGRVYSHNYRALNAIGTNLAGPVMQFNLVVSLGLAIFFLGERLTPLRITGILLIVAGPAIVRLSRQRPPRRPRLRSRRGWRKAMRSRSWPPFVTAPARRWCVLPLMARG